jgi:hypothetical protein
VPEEDLEAAEPRIQQLRSEGSWPKPVCHSFLHGGLPTFRCRAPHHAGSLAWLQDRQTFVQPRLACIVMRAWNLCSSLQQLKPGPTGVLTTLNSVCWDFPVMFIWSRVHLC